MQEVAAVTLFMLAESGLAQAFYPVVHKVGILVSTSK